MCGRFVSASPPEEIAEYFSADAVGARLGENHNVAPSSDIYVVYEDGTQRRVDPFHWGLVPRWAKDLAIGNKMTNARSETAAEKNSFKSSLSKKRCIIPADGFYEWKQIPGRRTKQPFYIHRVDHEPLAFAGLWSEWTGDIAGESTTVRSATILTTSANETMEPIHHRMPVILAPQDWGSWLDVANVEIARVQPLMVPAPAGLLTMHPVSTEVNNARNKGAHLTDEVNLDDAEAGASAGDDGDQGSLL